MLLLKKVYRDELLQLALILSLLRVNQNGVLDYNIYNTVANLDFGNGTSWRSLSPTALRSHLAHPKSLDSVLLNYERDLFADLNSLGRYNRPYYRHPDVTAYLLNIERGAPLANAETLAETLPEVPAPQNTTHEPHTEPTSTNEPATEPGLELTQEVNQ